MPPQTKPHFAIDTQPHERLLAEIVLSAARETDPTRFFATYLQHAVQLSTARHAIVWLVNADGSLSPLAHVNRGESWTPAELSQAAQVAANWAQRWQGFAPTFFDVRAEPGDSHAVALSGPRLIVPLRREHEIRGFLELFLTDAPSDLERTHLGDHALVLAAAGEQFLLRHHRPANAPGPIVSRSLAELLQLIHARLDLTATCFAVANETRRHLDCDRVAVVLFDHATAKVAAISGKERFDPRSTIVQAMERACQASVLQREPIWLDESAREAPPLRQALRELSLVSPARLAVIWPLVLPAAPVADPNHSPADDFCGWLIIEHFDATSDAAVWRGRLAELSPHITLALRNASEHEHLPLRRLGQTIRRNLGRRQWPRAAITLTVIGVLLATVCLVPTQLRIEAQGELQPVERQHVFAPTDGIVQEVLVTHGQQVAENDVLVVLRRPELDFELTRVQGELQTAERRLSTSLASRLRDKPSLSASSTEQQQLSADEAELKQLVAGLKLQQAELLRQQSALTIRSRQAGRVLTWDVQQSLAARPVQRGQVLLTVGRHDGPWQLELDVREDRVGYVLAAERASADPVPLDFRLASDPRRTLTTHVTQIAERSEFKTPQQPTVCVTAAALDIPAEQLRPGAAVVASVQCGSVSLARAWFIDLIHYLRVHWWW